MTKTTAEIIYEQSVTAIEQQSRQLDEVRGRSAIVLAAAGVVAGFLGKPSVENGFGPFGTFGLLAFIACAFCCIWVLLPRWDTGKGSDRPSN